MSERDRSYSPARTALMLGVSAGALIFATPALAQEQPAPPPDDQTIEGEPAVSIEPAQPPVEPDASGEIVVTGSRIRRNEATSASPLQIIDPTIALRQGQASTAEMIQSSPIAGGSSQINSAISTNFVTNGGPGSQTISLRGLGAERTLVLLNSRRAGPAGTRGGVTAFDLNVLPSSIIKSVEILKDGASSIYGSDAIAGVVNILTKTDTDGLELLGSATTPFQDGGEQYDISATWGKDFGRGHILLSASYYKQKMLRRQDRKFLGCPEDYIFRSDGETRADLIDPRTNRPACINGVTWGHVWTYFAYNLPDFGDGILVQPDYGDNLGEFIPGIPAPTGYGELQAPPGYFPVAYEGSGVANALTNSYSPIEAKSSVIPKTSRKTIYADGAFDVTDDIELYAEFLYNNRSTFTDYQSQIYNYAGLNRGPTEGEPFPGFYQPFGGFIYLSPTGIFDEYDNKVEVDYYRTVAGVRGEIANNWRWDLYGQHSRSDGKYTYDQIIEDALYTQWFKYGSCEGQVTAISGRQCIDINWVDPDFLAGNFTQEQRDFLLGTETGRTKYTQTYVEGVVTGDLFRLPAGPVGIAVGAVHRRDEINDRPGNITMAPNPFFDSSIPEDSALCNEPEEPCAEFVDNAYANLVSSGHTRGHSITQEAFGEINIPILRDSPFARSLTVSGAARITNVKAVRGSDGFSDKSNGNWTYKVMGNWQVTDWVRLRSTYGTSFRAPALFEQFLAGQVTGARQVNVDPCVNWADSLGDGTITQRQADNCAADGIPSDHSGGGIQVKIFNSGGIGQLEPETSRSWTASMILTPRFAFLPETNLALTVDYFDIKVEGEITQLGAANIVGGCYNSEDFPNEPLCDLFERGQIGNANLINFVMDSFINVNRQRNRGIDFTLRADHRFSGDTRFSLLANATYQLQDDITLFGGNLDELNGEIGDPKFTADVNLNLDRGPLSLFWGVDFVGKTSNEKAFLELNGALCNLTPEAVAIYGDHCYDVTTQAMFYHSASVTHRFVEDRFEITAGIANILDSKPPRISTAAVSGANGQIPGLASQYDWLGRRFFISAKARFK